MPGQYAKDFDYGLCKIASLKGEFCLFNTVVKDHTHGTINVLWCPLSEDHYGKGHQVGTSRYVVSLLS